MVKGHAALTQFCTFEIVKHLNQLYFLNVECNRTYHCTPRMWCRDNNRWRSAIACFQQSIPGTNLSLWPQYLEHTQQSGANKPMFCCTVYIPKSTEAFHSEKQKIHFCCAFTHDWWRRAAGSEGWPEEGRKHWGGRRTRSPTPHQSLCQGVSAGTCCWWTWNGKHETTSYITEVTIRLLTRNKLVEINLAPTWFESTLISKSTYIYVQKFCFRIKCDIGWNLRNQIIFKK